MGIKIPVDFSKVPERGSVRVPEGDYVAKLVKAEKTNAKSSGNPMLVIRLELQSGPKDARGKALTDRHILVEDSLWTLRNMLEAMGYKVKPAAMKIDVDKMLIGKKVGITVVDGDEYNGRIRSEVGDYIPVSAVGKVVKADDADLFDDDEDEEEFDLDDEEDVEDDEESEDSDDEESEDDESEDEEEFEIEDDEESEDEAEWPSASEIQEMKADELKALASEIGVENLDLPKKPKKADLIEALVEYVGEDEDDEDMEEFDLDDI